MKPGCRTPVQDVGGDSGDLGLDGTHGSGGREGRKESRRETIGSR